MVPCLTCHTPCRGPRCPTHQREHKAKYDKHHRQHRRDLEAIVSTGDLICPRCSWPIQPGEPWDLGHHPTGSRPEHARCNRQAGGRSTH